MGGGLRPVTRSLWSRVWCHDGMNMNLGNGFIEEIKMGPGGQRGFSGDGGGRAGS